MTKRSEAGAATVLALVWIGVILAVGAGCVLAAGVVVVHRQAQAAADLASLAAAQAHQRGEPGCEAAHHIAARNGAVVDACVAEGADYRVRVGVDAPARLSMLGSVMARAQAGPVAGGDTGLNPIAVR